MEQLYGRCHADCSKAAKLAGQGLPGHLHAGAQKCIKDLEELLAMETARATGSAPSSANSSQDQLMLVFCSVADLACVGMDVALDLSKRVDTLEGDMLDLSKRVSALEGDRALLVLREISVQCENKLYRLCLKVPMSAKEVVHGSLARLKKDKRLDPPRLQHFLDKWKGMEEGLEALKEISMGGGKWVAVAHPQQGASPSREELVSLVEQHAGPLVRPDILEVIEVLVFAAEKLKEPLFVETMDKDDG